MANPNGPWPTVTRWKPEILAAAKKYGVDPSILAAVVQHESGGREGLTSSAGAQGLTQFMPGTAATYHVNVSPGHALSQIEGTAHYLKDLGINSNPLKALAAYGAGPGNIPGGMGYARADLAISKNYKGLDGQTIAAPSTPGASGTRTRTIPGTDNSAARRDLIAQFVMQGGPENDNALIGLASGLQGAQDTPGKTVTTVGSAAKPTPLGPSSNAPPSVQQIVQRANAINAKHYNYEWGGGHDPGGTPSHGVGHGSGPGVGFDCSGVVSRIFGINPRVAAQFESWGQAGKGQYVTVYANGTHTFMEINGHFFGTSASNPGGGAGWIPRGVISPGYLKGFVARHPGGM